MVKLVKTEEIIENGETYIVNTYDNGTVEKYAKPDENIPEPEPQPEPVTLKSLQDKIDQLEQQNMALMMGMVDVYSAITTGGQE